MARWKQCIYKLKNPDKYIGGNKEYIRCMSSWEIEAHTFFDTNANILAWASEPLPIPYVKPTDGKVHRYFPDYYIKYLDKYGNIIQEIVEIKPHAQTVLRENASQIERVEYSINQAKWRYAKAWCDAHEINFRVMTEVNGNKRVFNQRKKIVPRRIKTHTIRPR